MLSTGDIAWFDYTKYFYALQAEAAKKGEFSALIAGGAQDEVRKLSERLKFGFRQSIINGHVLGNDRLWGYDNRDCKLTVNPEQARVVRLIFELYATGRYGVRSLSRELTARGFSSLEPPFNQATIRHVLTDPKYKGWYCGNKTRSLDYRTKKQVSPPREEWVMYRDPEIPAIVSEALWDRANAIFRARSARSGAHSQGGGDKYPYSGKIFCGIHGDCFHRQCLHTRQGGSEYWRCKRYRDLGKAGCPLPALRSRELDAVLEVMFHLKSGQQVPVHLSRRHFSFQLPEPAASAPKPAP